MSGSTVYVGGRFNGVDSINGDTLRNRAAAVDATSGEVTGWDPNLEDEVYALAVSGATVYLGGLFNGTDSVNGDTQRDRAAAVDATTGEVNGWDPDLNAPVRAIAVSGSTVYLGGDFQAINGLTLRGSAAAVDATTGVAKASYRRQRHRPRAGGRRGDGLPGRHVPEPERAERDVRRDHLAAVDATTGVVTAGTPSPTATSTRWRSTVAAA